MKMTNKKNINERRQKRSIKRVKKEREKERNDLKKRHKPKKTVSGKMKDE